MNIRNIFNLKKVVGDIGLEIELEGRNLPVGGIPYPWVATKDGSLKSGMEGYEYVLSAPCAIDDVPLTLKQFKLCFKDSTVINSIYAGIHTHVNVQELTPKQLITYLCAYIILEDLLVDWCGDTRVGNHFCLRTSDASYLIDFIRGMIVDESLNKCKKNDNIRYASVNLKALGQYGSLEFRALEASLDIDKIITWCNVLYRIKEESLRYDNPESLILNFSKYGHMTFIMNMLGPHYLTFTRKKGWENVIREGVVRAQELAFAKKWDELSYNIFKQNSGGF
jgi:hypothetical protein